MFYIYTDEEYYLIVNKKTMKISRTKDITKTSYWGSKKYALTWFKHIKNKYPNMMLKEAVLTLK